MTPRKTSLEQKSKIKRDEIIDNLLTSFYKHTEETTKGALDKFRESSKELSEMNLTFKKDRFFC